MADRQIRLFGDPVLRTVSDPISEITESVRKLVVDLEQATDLPGRAGVAAPQIGVNLRAFSYKVDG
jgi:peptide deformylase